MKSSKFKLRKLFLDWSPEFTPFISQLGEIKNLEFLAARGCRVDDESFMSLMDSVKTNKVRLKLLDMYSNQLTDESIMYLSDFVKDYKFVESYGFGMNSIRRLSSFEGLFDQLGTIEVGKSDFDQFREEWKQRENLIAKNAKAKIAKKPEESLPYIEEVQMDEAAGKYYKKQYPNLLYLNLVGNNLDKEHDYGYLESMLKRNTHIQLILSYTKLDKHLDPKLIESYTPKIYLK